MSLLNYKVPAEEIAAAIEEAQARCRVGLVKNPLELAKKARHAIDVAEKASLAVGLQLKDVSPEGQWWEGRHQTDTTYLKLRSPWNSNALGDVEIEVIRGKPWTAMNNGHIKLTIKNGELW
jgi:hypothetical protein